MIVLAILSNRSDYPSKTTFVVIAGKQRQGPINRHLLMLSACFQRADFHLNALTQIFTINLTNSLHNLTFKFHLNLGYSSQTLTTQFFLFLKPHFHTPQQIGSDYVNIRLMYSLVTDAGFHIGTESLSWCLSYLLNLLIGSFTRDLIWNSR